MAQYLHLSQVDPEIAPLLEPSAPSIPLEESSLPAIRRYLAEVGVPQFEKQYQPFLPESSEYTIKDHEIDVGMGATVAIRSTIPVPRDEEDGTFPLLFWIHGGGFVLGNLRMEDYKLRITTVKLRLSVVNCEYRLAPEHPFPTAVDDLTAALKYVASHPDTFSASLKKGFLIGGQSAGGNLGAVLAWIARDDPFFGSTPLTGQLLQVPTVVHPQAIPDKYKSSLLSFEQNRKVPTSLLSVEEDKNAPTLNGDNILQVLEFYNPTPEDPRFSPLLLPSHKGLPSAFLQVCGLDPLRDEGLLYEKVLKEAGVPTKLEVYPGVPHGFEMAYFDIKQATRFREDFHDGIRWLLAGEKPS
ncbi:hypothetical protein L218DRAFT_953447 [Marasmius fiardii PR-910]|nr:hypothetical protein L218DRAFT_953447 [Marasmius fiardii PR-910]